MVVYAFASLGIELTRNTGRIASVWFANAVILAAILKHPTQRWALILALAYAGNLLANLHSGDSLVLATLLSACNILEVLVAAVLVLRFSDSLDFHRSRPMIILLLACIGPATLVSATVASFVLAQVVGADFLQVFITWYPADVLGFVTLTPLLLVLHRNDLTDLIHPKVFGKLVVVIALTLATVAAIFLQRSMPLLFLAFPVLLIAVWLMGYVGGAVALATLTVGAFVATLNDLGPISLMQPDPRLKILALQGFSATAALTGIAVAAVLFELSMLRAAIAQAPDFLYVKNLRGECRRPRAASTGMRQPRSRCWPRRGESSVWLERPRRSLSARRSRMP